jgi:hypothetical protein
MRYVTPVVQVTLGAALAIGSYNVATGSSTGLGFLAYGLLFLIALGVTVHGLFLGVETAVAAARSPGPAAGRDTTADGPRSGDGAAGD